MKKALLLVISATLFAQPSFTAQFCNENSTFDVLIEADNATILRVSSKDECVRSRGTEFTCKSATDGATYPLWIAVTDTSVIISDEAGAVISQHEKCE